MTVTEGHGDRNQRQGSDHMSGVIQEAHMMFEELIDDDGMRDALDVLRAAIDAVLDADGAAGAAVQAERLAAAYGAVYERLAEQR
jgi:hypothetical protein